MSTPRPAQVNHNNNRDNNNNNNNNGDVAGRLRVQIATTIPTTTDVQKPSRRTVYVGHAYICAMRVRNADAQCGCAMRMRNADALQMIWCLSVAGCPLPSYMECSRSATVQLHGVQQVGYGSGFRVKDSTHALTRYVYQTWQAPVCCMHAHARSGRVLATSHIKGCGTCMQRTALARACSAQAFAYALPMAPMPVLALARCGTAAWSAAVLARERPRRIGVKLVGTLPIRDGEQLLTNFGPLLSLARANHALSCSPTLDLLSQEERVGEEPRGEERVGKEPRGEERVGEEPRG
eukprot:88988-Chlamydomonas_euryale.AAC.1